MKMLFKTGNIYSTPGALTTLLTLNQDGLSLLKRHVSGDWGDLCADDIRANEYAVKHGERVFSSYVFPGDVKIWVITEWDRSATTILLPSEY